MPKHLLPKNVSKAEAEMVEEDLQEMP